MNNVSILDTPYHLSARQITQFQADGHICLRNILSKHELEPYKTNIYQTVKSATENHLDLNQRDTYGKAFLQVMNVWTLDEQIKLFVMAKRFAKIAADLMGVDGVRIYHDQALYKEPGGGHTPWHQDQTYWPLDTSNTITMWMPLVDITAEVGSMTFASGSHKLGYISKLAISDESHKTLGDYIKAKQIPTVSHGAMKAGDATFHYGWTLHSAPSNPTDQLREVMTIIFMADGTKVTEIDHPNRQGDLEQWMPGLKAGDKVNSPLNPLVYKKLPI